MAIWPFDIKQSTMSLPALPLKPARGRNIVRPNHIVNIRVNKVDIFLKVFCCNDLKEILSFIIVYRNGLVK